MKHHLKLLFLGLMVMGLLAACSLPVAPGRTENNRTLNVSGTGRVTIVPDMATIHIGVRTEADTVTDALDSNSAQANAISRALQGMGIEEKDIQTSNFNVYPTERYDYMTGEVGERYFVVENTVNVTVRDLASLGEVLSTTVDAGANNIYGINFNVEDREAAAAEARQLAIEDAQAKAELIADAAGVQLGELVNINFIEGGYPGPFYYEMGMGGMTEGDVPIAAGTLTITMECSLTYAIE